MGKLYLGTDEIAPVIYDKEEGASPGIPLVLDDGTLRKATSTSDNFTFSLPSSVTALGEYALYYATYNSSSGSAGLVAVDLSNIRSIARYSLYAAFQYCANLTSVLFTNLESITGLYSMSNAFSGTAITSVTFSSLTNLDADRCMDQAFAGATRLANIYFPAITTSTFGTRYKNQFSRLVQNVTGCTLHFPDGTQSVVEALTNYPNFGGTNTTVLFDL